MMKREYSTVITIILLCALFKVPSLQAENGFTWNSVNPDKAPSPVKVLVIGKKLTYYPLEKGDEIFVTIEGPTRMRVLTRIEFGSDLGGEKRYYLRYERDDGKMSKFRRATTAAASAVLADHPSTHLGTSRSIYIKVPEGKHTYRFYVGSKSNYRLYLRFYERIATVNPDADNVAFAPSMYTTSVPLIIKEEEVTYYRSGQQDSVRLSIIGPTTIKVLARLEFDPTMIANQKFRINVLEDGIEKHIYPLRSEPSEVAEYLNVSETIVGKGAKFFIEVPRGKHEYCFKIIDNGRNVLLRFYIPSEDLKNNL